MLFDDDQMSLAYMDEIPCPEPYVLPKRVSVGPPGEEAPPPRGHRGRPLTVEQALASIARDKRKSPKATIRKAYKMLGDDVTLSRFVKLPGERTLGRMRRERKLPGFNHPKIEAGRTLFTERGVKRVDQVANALVSGYSNVKIGRDIRAGNLFRGYWLYTLTLEERATCPRTCQHWVTCYGNNMPFAKRIEHGHALLRQLEWEIPRLLNQRGRAGVMVRLHALGDFYSVQYVAFWDAMLQLHPNLAAFGYTARRRDDPIGAALAVVKERHGRRFAIRWSGGGEDEDCTVSLAPGVKRAPGAFTCPEQTGKTAACATCGLCWNTTKNVAFMDHA